MMESPRDDRDLVVRLDCHALDRSNLYTSLTHEAAQEIRRLRKELERSALDLQWAYPSLQYRSGRGLSSEKLIRHCLAGEPLDETWERPFDHHDLIGATKTAGMAPEHHRETARAVIEQYREWLAAEGPEGEKYVRRADAELAEELSGA